MTYRNQPSARTGLGQAIALGDLVRFKKDGRVGRVTQVTREKVFVRFEEGAKAVYLDRVQVDSVKFLEALAEVEQDDAAEVAFDDFAADAYRGIEPIDARDDDGGWDADAAYERHLETRYEEDPRDLEDEANDVGLQDLRAGRIEVETIEDVGEPAPLGAAYPPKAWTEGRRVR